MASILVLFNLKPGVDVAAYEKWARERDLPTVRGLGSVSGFDVLRAQNLLFGDGKPPYQLHSATICHLTLYKKAPPNFKNLPIIPFLLIAKNYNFYATKSWLIFQN
jgi:hypothetical protein